MPSRTTTLRASFAAALLWTSLSASVGSAEPLRRDALRMRSISRLDPSLAKAPTSQPEPAPATASEPPPAPLDVHTVDHAASGARAVLEQCFAIARRADAELADTVTVLVKVTARDAVELHARTAELGTGYFSRCVERKQGSFHTLEALPAADAATRIIVLRAK